MIYISFTKLMSFLFLFPVSWFDLQIWLIYWSLPLTNTLDVEWGRALPQYWLSFLYCFASGKSYFDILLVLKTCHITFIMLIYVYFLKCSDVLQQRGSWNSHQVIANLKIWKICQYEILSIDSWPKLTINLLKESGF